MVKFLVLGLVIIYSSLSLANPVTYGELFFVEKDEHVHTKLQVLGTSLTDNNLIDSYGLLINKSVFMSKLWRLSVEGTFRNTELTSTAKKLEANSEVEQRVNQPEASFHFVPSLLVHRAKGNVFNKLFPESNLYLDLGLGFTKYKENTTGDMTPFSIYGGLTLDIPIKTWSVLIRWRRVSDNPSAEDKFTYNELMLGAGFRW